MHISEIGFCSGHSASGVYINERAETTVPGLYAAGDMANVPHNYMLGAFTYGWFAGTNAADYCAQSDAGAIDPAGIAQEMQRVAAPLTRGGGFAAQPGGIQAAPHGQRLSTAAEGDPQDEARAGTV